MSKIETLTVNTIKNLEDVWFEPVDSGLYIMNGTMKNGFTIDVGVTEELKREIEKLTSRLHLRFKRRIGGEMNFQSVKGLRDFVNC